MAKGKRSKPSPYYSLDRILAERAHYYMVVGSRSTGKTYAALRHGLEKYFKDGSQMAIIRRWQDDYTGRRGSTMFDALISTGDLELLSGGEWTGVHYFGGRWYLCKYADGQRIDAGEPFCYGFALSSTEHDKSTSYPKVRTIVFDEFIARNMYLPEEFVSFTNTLSTIIRQRDDVEIFMLGNTISKYCPYFAEMGLTHVKDMEPGAIEVYTYGTSDLRVAVEFADAPSEGRASDVYFAFGNPKLAMITGHGGSVWELGSYPHIPRKYTPAEISTTFFIDFERELLQCELIQQDDAAWIYIHEKTTPLRDEDHDIIYSTKYDPRPNWRRRIAKPVDDIDRRLYAFFLRDKVFYQDNSVGEIVNAYLHWCRSF